MLTLGISVIYEILSSFFLALFFLFAGSIVKNKALRLFGTAYLCYAISVFMSLFHMTINSHFFHVLELSTLIMFSMFISYSTFLIFNKINSYIFTTPIFVFGFVWIIITHFIDTSSFIRNVVPYTIAGLNMIFTGITIIILLKKSQKAFILVGIVQIFLGVHLLDYPFLAHIDKILPAGFIISSFLEFFLAFSFVIAFFMEKQSIEENTTLKYKTILNATQDSIMIIEDKKIIDCNNATCDIFKYDKDEIIGKTPDFLSPYIQSNGRTSEKEVERRLHETIKNRTSYFEWTHKTKTGKIFPAEVRLNVFMENNKTKIVAVVRDISKRKSLEDFFNISEMAFNNSIETFVVTDINGNITYVNKRFEELTGFSTKEALGKNPRLFKSDRHDDLFYKDLWTSILEKGHWSGEIWNRKKNGELFLAQLDIAALRGLNNDITNFIAIMHDITAKRKSEEDQAIAATKDSLTDFVNKNYFYKLLENKLLTEPKNNSSQVVLLNIDIDEFKYINENYGHVVGDDLLVAFSRRLEKCTTHDTVFARFSGDEFLILTKVQNEDNAITEIIKKIYSKVESPFKIGKDDVFITLAIGIAFAHDSDFTADDLLKKANTALHQAKSLGKNQFAFFKPALTKNIYERLTIDSKLRKAIKNDELTVFFQAKIDALTNTVSGMEALVRWITSDKKIIPPNSFIPLIETTDLIYPVGKIVLEKACAWTAAWNNTHDKHLRVAINLSAKQFENYNILNVVEEIIDSVKIDSQDLELEITEGVFLKNTKEVFSILQKFKDMGIHTSLDDFGKGYSSLSYLKQLPIDGLKIDKSFIDDIETNYQARKIITSIFKIAHDLKLKTVAEGVETEGQRDILLDIGCDIFQGFYFAPPYSEKDFDKFVNDYSRKSYI